MIFRHHSCARAAAVEIFHQAVCGVPFIHLKQSNHPAKKDRVCSIVVAAAALPLLFCLLANTSSSSAYYKHFSQRKDRTTQK